MNRIFATVVFLFCLGCGTREKLPEVPLVAGPVITTAEEAKAIARRIAWQECKFNGYKSLGDDAGEYTLECEKGVYHLYVDRVHLYDHGWSREGEVRFKYSEKLLINPQFKEHGRKDLYPAFYLMPVP